MHSNRERQISQHLKPFHMFCYLVSCRTWWSVSLKLCINLHMTCKVYLSFVPLPVDLSYSCDLINQTTDLRIILPFDPSFFFFLMPYSTGLGSCVAHVMCHGLHLLCDTCLVSTRGQSTLVLQFPFTFICITVNLINVLLETYVAGSVSFTSVPWWYIRLCFTWWCNLKWL